MKRFPLMVGFIAMACLLAVWPGTGLAQGGFEVVSGQAVVRAVPGDFYLEGNRIPVDKRYAVLLKNTHGARLVVANINTAGYSSQIKQKYTGMVITETKISVCGTELGVGSYGFGLDRPAPPSTADATFRIYNQAGEKLGECAAKRDDTIKQPTPLTVTAPQGGPVKVALGKYVIEIH